MFVPERPLGGGLLRGILHAAAPAADVVLVADDEALLAQALEALIERQQSVERALAGGGE